MRKQIYTSKVFWSQIVLWLPLFLVPIIYSPFGLFSWQESLSQYIVPLSMMIVAYINYFVFAPKLLKGNEKEFWIYNIVLILFLSIAQHEWLYYTGTERYIISFSYQLLFQNVEENINPHLFFITRNIFNLSICAGAATSVLMAQRWSKAEEEKREAETAMTKAELINLRQQVNPHFMLNTMNNIYALTAFDTEKAQKAIIDLSKMLRHILYDYQQPYVSLKEEVEFLNGLPSRRAHPQPELEHQGKPGHGDDGADPRPLDTRQPVRRHRPGQRGDPRKVGRGQRPQHQQHRPQAPHQHRTCAEGIPKRLQPS